MTEKQEIMRTGADLPAVQADSPMAILAQLAKEGGGADQLAVIAELVWKQEDREAEREFARDFAAFQRECPPIRKTQHIDTVTKTGMKIDFFFAPLEEIERVVKPLLLKHGISYAWDSEPKDGKMVITCNLFHENGKQRKATFISPMEGGMPTMSASQKHASSMTYGRRQSLVAALGIGHADTDTDSLDPLMGGSVTEEQAAELRDLAEHPNVDTAAFLRWIGSEEFEDIASGQYETAKAALLRKVKA